jgi:hypothetical protein
MNRSVSQRLERRDVGDKSAVCERAQRAGER